MNIAHAWGGVGSLGRRFDSVALRPPAARPGETHRLRTRPVTTQSLQAWCYGGPPQPLAEALLCEAAGGDADDSLAWADAFAREIDGSHRLAALPGPAARLVFRLAVKCQDAMPWRRRRPADPWDAGWLINTPTALRHLREDWRPRRATLLLADAAAGALQSSLAALQQRAADLRHPVRWLWVGHPTGEHALAVPPVRRFELD